MSRPEWFREGQVVVSTANTCGINKDGHELYVVDSDTGFRTETVDDKLAKDVSAILRGETTDSVQWVPIQRIDESRLAVPTYYDRRYHLEFERELRINWPNLQANSLAQLVESGQLTVRKGHGSPSSDLRTGSIPYIKVSDLRAGSVNINPTNMVPGVVAERFWKGPDSGLRAFDLICPERASKNIGDFCLLMPGQERIVLTKEVLILRPGPNAEFDAFYLLWALSLRVVRRQWERVIFMQTNREDVGDRYLEIEIPVPPDRETADALSQEFRQYFLGIAALRQDFGSYLDQDKHHHFFVGPVETTETPRC